MVDGQLKRGFAFYVGGGLGAVPYAAELVDEFLPEEELLPMTQAIARVFARLGEKENRARARIKFLVKKLGIEEFKRLVLEERKTLRPDPRWTAFLADLHVTDEKPLRPAAPLAAGAPGRETPASTPGARPTSCRRASRLRGRDPGLAARRSHRRSGARAGRHRARCTPATPCARPSIRTCCSAG